MVHVYLGRITVAGFQDEKLTLNLQATTAPGKRSILVIICQAYRKTTGFLCGSLPLVKSSKTSIATPCCSTAFPDQFRKPTKLLLHDIFYWLLESQRCSLHWFERTAHLFRVVQLWRYTNRFEQVETEFTKPVMWWDWQLPANTWTPKTSLLPCSLAAKQKFILQLQNAGIDMHCSHDFNN